MYKTSKKQQGVPDDIFELKTKFFESEAKNKTLIKDITALKSQCQHQSNQLYQLEFSNPINDVLET